MIVFNLALTGDGYRQLNERPYQLSVDFLAPLRRFRAGRVKEQRPVDGALAWYRAETQEIRKEGHRISLWIQLVVVTNLSMPIPIGSVGKLERYKSSGTRAKPLRAFSKHLTGKRLPNDLR